MKIVIVYDRLFDLIHAYNAWRQVVTRFVNEIQIHSRAWNFSLLHDRHSREQSARHTAEADMILLSASAHNDLPGHVKEWIASWLPHKSGGGNALVAVLDDQSPVPGASPALRDYLCQTAKQGGMDFFCNMDHPSDAGRLWQDFENKAQTQGAFWEVAGGRRA